MTQTIQAPHRPRYHFLPPTGWLNDPNGFIHHQGVYHLFYQHNPAGGFHADIQWGHAVSDDLVHWQHRPIALTPTPGGPDSGGCWSGSAVIAGDGRPMVFYTGVFPQTVCAATGSDDLERWAKHPANPLIAAPPPGFGGDTADFRDPYVWRDGDGWQMVIGSRVVAGQGAVLRYRSADLLTWEYAGPLLVGDPVQEPYPAGGMWECPNLLPLGDRHLLILSHQDERGALLYPGYVLGDFDGQRFVAAPPRLVDYGGCLYAPQAIVDERGRVVFMGWLMEGRDAAAQRAAGWSGVMSLPRLLSLGDDDTVRVRPAPALEQLRGERLDVGPRLLRPGDANPLAGLRGGGLEIELVLETEGATAYGLSWAGLEGEPLVAGCAALRIDVATETLTLEGSPFAGARPAPLPGGGPVRLRVFLDRSVVEVFVDDRAVLSSRFYAARPDDLRPRLFVEGGRVRMVSLVVWRIGQI